MDAVDLSAERKQFLAAGGGHQCGLFGDLAPAQHHGGFFFGGRIIDDELEKKTVGLRLGQRVSALLLDGILGGHHEERLGQWVRLAADGDLALLHGLEEGGLDLGGGAVDFVGEYEIGKNGAAVGREFAVLRRENHGAHDVAGQEIGGKLDALKLDAEGGTEGLDEQGFCEAGHALEQDMAVGEEGHQETFHDGVLADDGFGNFGAEFLGPSGTGEHEKN